MENPSYRQVDNIRNHANNIFHEVVTLLGEKDIKLRQDDGELIQINISIPTSIKNSFVIGLRYVKKDRTHTEDPYLIKKEIKETDKEIVYLRGRKLEKLLTEYKGTHKQQINISQIENDNNSKIGKPLVLPVRL
jgi:hypothetical protein